MDEWINTVDQGTAVEVRTAHGAWIAAVADSRVGSAMTAAAASTTSRSSG